MTEFIISKDPKLSVSNQDLRNLELFQLKVIDKISEAKILENKIEKMLSEKKLNKKKSLVLKAQQDMTTKEGTYMQPMLVASTTTYIACYLDQIKKLVMML